jgi:hypothetical protein
MKRARRRADGIFREPGIAYGEMPNMILRPKEGRKERKKEFQFLITAASCDFLRSGFASASWVGQFGAFRMHFPSWQ